jgi:2-polyprenyl-3-methyl-5-hydroxy-6-metoxy-1,4-benzoquinol methylase
MKEAVTRQLVALNSVFYETLAEPFSNSRSSFPPGFHKVLDLLPRRPLIVLDVGCGNGRFGRFLVDQGLLAAYTGIDSSVALLALAQEPWSRLIERDLSQANCLDGVGEFEVIVCLATLQHIPGRLNRERLLREMARHMVTGGRIVLSNWQFLDNARQRRKIRPWAEVGIDASQVEDNDYLLSWERGGSGLRYVAYLNSEITSKMASDAELRVVTTFRSDGKENNLNLYTVMAG